MTGAYSIRQAEPSDLRALLGLERQRFHTDLIPAASFRRWLRLAHDGLGAAFRGDELAGYVLVLRRRGSSLARLYSLAVDEAHLGQGLGRLLLDWGEARALSWGADRMRLEVGVDNQAAIRLYSAAGYEPVRQLPAYYEDGSTALRMQKPLRQ